MTKAGTGWIWIGVMLGMLAFYTSALAQEQSLTDKDKANINFKATQKLNDLNELLNTLAGENLEKAEADTAIRNSSHLGNFNRLFLNNSVQIEDDIDPSHISADSTADTSIETYMHDLYTNYAKTSLDKPIVFSEIKLFPVQQTGTSIYIKVTFTSLFKNRNKYSALAYRSTKRVVEMRVEKVNNKWNVYITRLGFLRPGEGIAPVVKPKPKATVAFVKPVVPTNLKIGGPEVIYRQPDDDYTATLKFDRAWLQVVQTGSAELPVGFYQRQGKNELYMYDSLINITLEKNSDQFTFRKGLNFKKYVRVKPVAATTPAKPQTSPVNLQINKEDSIRTARLQAEQRAAKPAKPAVDTTARVAINKIPKDKKDTKNTPDKLITVPATLSPPPIRPDTTNRVAFQAQPLTKLPDKGDEKRAKKEKVKPIVAVPDSKTLSPTIANALSADARQQKARLRTLGWLQVVAGAAGLAGSYVGYSTIKKDYDAYSAKLTKLNADYTIWQGLTRQPASNPAAAMSLTSYGSPGIYGAYAGGGISLGLLVNGIRSLGKAGKIKPKLVK